MHPFACEHDDYLLGWNLDEVLSDTSSATRDASEPQSMVVELPALKGVQREWAGIEIVGSEVLAREAQEEADEDEQKGHIRAPND